MTPSRVPRSRQRPARKRRVPKLVFTERRNIGWHVSFRDPKSGKPTRHRFGMVSEEDARVAYYQWLARHMAGEAADAPKAIVKGQGATRLAEESGAQGTTPPPLPPRASDVQISQHSLAAVASGYLDAEQARSREPGQPRSPGTISLLVFEDRRTHVATARVLLPA